MEDPSEASSRQPTSVFFCGVSKEVSPSAAVGGIVGGPVHDGNTAPGSSIQPQEGGGARAETFSQGRGRRVQDPGILKYLYPDIDEGEMPTVHFIVRHRRYCKGGSLELRS